MTVNSSDTYSTPVDVGGDRHDELFAILSDSRRRFVLHTLQFADREMSVSELTADVVSWEADMTDSGTVEDVRGAVEVSLVHTHLPKMDQAGLLNYDHEGGSVRFTDYDHELGVHLGAVKAAVAGDD